MNAFAVDNDLSYSESSFSNLQIDIQIISNTLGLCKLTINAYKILCIYSPLLFILDFINI